MPTIYTFGETVYDIIFEDSRPVTAKAGGAMLNSAVSLARAGHHVCLLTEMGLDAVGEIILDFLKDNGVDTQYVNLYKESKTPVALAFLNGDKSASYSFYKKYPRQRLTLQFPEPEKGDVVLFGSFYSLSADIRGKLMQFIQTAKEKGAMIIYDPNIRKNHAAELREVFPYVMENIAVADIVRGSDEDFENLFNCCENAKVYKQINELGCKYVIITRGEKGAELVSGDTSLKIPAKKIKVTSTIGAGDSFNAGIIHSILDPGRKSMNPDELSMDEWKAILQHGIDFAENSCKSYDNYISQEFGKSIKNS